MSKALELRPIPGLDGYYCNRIGEIFSQMGRMTRWKRRLPMPAKPQKLKCYCTRGYLRFLAYSSSGDGTRTRVPVHHAVLLTFVGPRPEGLNGLHRNGNKTDNRPENLYWGTVSDNNTDTVRHGRQKDQILDEKTVLEIRRVNAENPRITRTDLAKRYGVTARQIQSILSGRKWRFVGGPLDSASRAHSFGRKLTQKDVVEIRNALAENPQLTDAAVAHAYGVHKVTIGHIRLGKIWPHAGGPRTVRTRGRAQVVTTPGPETSGA